jgi:hypothetical protein
LSTFSKERCDRTLFDKKLVDKMSTMYFKRQTSGHEEMLVNRRSLSLSSTDLMEIKLI